MAESETCKEHVSLELWCRGRQASAFDVGFVRDARSRPASDKGYSMNAMNLEVTAKIMRQRRIILADYMYTEQELLQLW